MTIKKKTLRLALLFLILFSMFIPGMAFASSDGVTRIHDEVGLLTPAQVDALDEKLGEISVRHDFDIAIVIVQYLSMPTAHQDAAEAFEYYDYGRGSGDDGAVLLIAMADRDFGFATTAGRGENVFTYEGQYYLDTLYVPYLSEGEYYQAFDAFADAADDFLTQAEAGKSYDQGNIPKSAEEKAKVYLICIIAGFIVGLIVALVLKAQLRSVRKDAFAREYIRNGSMMLRAQHDRFLYSTVSKTARSDNNSSGGGGSFSSSSGRSFSGHSGKF